MAAKSPLGTPLVKSPKSPTKSWGPTLTVARRRKMSEWSISTMAKSPMGTPIGEPYESFVSERVLVKYQSQSEVT